MPNPKIEEFKTQLNNVINLSSSTKDFYGITDIPKNNPFGFSFGRGALSCMSYAIMLQKGYKVEEIFDPANEQARTEAGAELVKAFNEKSKEEIVQYLSKPMLNMLDTLNDYMSDKINTSNPPEVLLEEKNKYLLKVAQLALDNAQELGCMKEQFIEATGITKDEYTQKTDKQLAMCNILSIYRKTLAVPQALLNHTNFIGTPVPDTKSGIELMVSKYLPHAVTLSYYVNKSDENNKNYFQDKPMYANASIMAGMSQTEIEERSEDYKKFVKMAESDEEAAYKYSKQLLSKDGIKNFATFGDFEVTKIKTVDEITHDAELKDKIDVEKALADAADKIYGEAVQNLSVTEKANKVMADNLVGTGSGKLYSDIEEKQPGDRLAELTKDISSNKEVYVYLPNEQTHKLEPHVFQLTGIMEVPTINKSATTILNPAQKHIVSNKIAEFKKALDATGTSRRDSQEFRDLKTAINSTLETINNSLNPNTYSQAIENLMKAADDYYFAKLDQSQNTKRSKRFELADKIRNLSDLDLSDVDRVKNNIAGKALKAYASALTKSKKQSDIDLGNQILSNRKLFKQEVKRIVQSDAFTAQYGNKNLKELRTAFAKKPANLVKSLVEPQPPQEPQRDNSKLELV